MDAHAGSGEHDGSQLLEPQACRGQVQVDSGGVRHQGGADFGSLHKPDLSTMPFTTFTARSARVPLSGLWFGGA